MTERVTRSLDFATGEVSEQRTRTTASSPGERWRGLRASAAEQLSGEVLGELLAVACDGCGLLVRVERPELPVGWVTNERGEFCPACVSGGDR